MLAAHIRLTDTQLAILQSFQRSKTASVRLVQRAPLIVLAAAGLLNLVIASQIDLDRKQVGLWRRRWQLSAPALLDIEQRESHAALRRTIEEVLSDAPRPGSPGTFTAEQVTLLLALACEPPDRSGRPITTWTGRELADEAIRRGIVPSISKSQVNRFLAQAALQPHRCDYWLNTTELDPQVFEQQVHLVCQTYQQAPDLYFQAHTHTVCVDEMPGMQALQRNAETQPMEPGQPMRIEYEYTRHGTLCLIGNWHVVQGQMIAPTLGATRTEEDFCQHIRQTIATDAEAGWVFVVDNLNIHCSEALVREVAALENIDPSTLGIKERQGILKSMASRRAFLEDLKHRVRFVYLPKHSSWLNQIEMVFGIVRRRALRHGSFASVEELRTRVTDFIEYFNRTFAKPFRWTYTGRPVVTEQEKRPETWRAQWGQKEKSEVRGHS